MGCGVHDINIQPLPIHRPTYGNFSTSVCLVHAEGWQLHSEFAILMKPVTPYRHKLNEACGKSSIFKDFQAKVKQTSCIISLEFYSLVNTQVPAWFLL
jgi:hypothetical protein